MSNKEIAYEIVKFSIESGIYYRKIKDTTDISENEKNEFWDLIDRNREEILNILKDADTLQYNKDNRKKTQEDKIKVYIGNFRLIAKKQTRTLKLVHIWNRCVRILDKIYEFNLLDNIEELISNGDKNQENHYSDSFIGKLMSIQTKDEETISVDKKNQEIIKHENSLEKSITVSDNNNKNNSKSDKNLKYSKNYLFLTRLDKKGLFTTDNNNQILLEFDDRNQLISSKKINENFREKELGYSLKDIIANFLNLGENEDIFNYLIPWEMELERIFNCIKYKYLQSVLKSGFDNPSKLLHSSYNRPFQALAGKNIYQGNVEVRRDNDDFFKDVGFKSPEETGVNFEKEKKEFNFIIRFLRKYYQNDLPRVYTELIAIKPGMHELLIHGNYFDLRKKHQDVVNKNKFNENSEDGKVDYRGEVFALLANVGDLEQSPIQKLNKLTGDINVNSYFTYASCNITEGPFVSRKIKDISYFDEIRKIHSYEEIKNIEDKFDVYYYDKCIDSKKKLEKVLYETEKFRSFPEI